MLRHHDVANHLEFIFLTDFFKIFKNRSLREAEPSKGFLW